MTAFTIVPWREEYAGAFRDLSLEWLLEYDLLEPADYAIIDRPHEAVLDIGGEIFFALSDGAPVGVAAMIPMGGGEYELAKLTVKKQMRRMGAADGLMDACLAFARSRGAKRIILYTNHALTAAHALYSKRGFADVRHENSKYEESDMKMVLDM